LRSAPQDEPVLGADLEELLNVRPEGHRLAPRLEPRPTLEESCTGLVIQVGAEANAGRSLLEQGPRDRLSDHPIPAAHLTDVEVRHAVRGQERRVPALELRTHGDVVQIDQPALEERERRRGEDVRLPPLGGDDAGGDQGTVPEDPRELPEGLGARAEVGEDLAETGELLVGAVERPVLAAWVVEAVLPAREMVGDVGEGGRGASEPPDRGGLGQSAAPANARAVGTTSWRSSGVRARRRTEAGAWSSSRVFVPKNQAFAVSAPYASTSMRAAW